MKKTRDKERIPTLPLRLFSRLLNAYTEIPVLGDLEEEFFQLKKEKGIRQARLWLRVQLIKSLPYLSKNFLYWSIIMFKNYLKTTFRNIIRQKGYSFINITGLAVGMAVCILILLWVQDELSYDRFHGKADNLYRVVEKWRYSSGEMAYNKVTPGPLAAVLKEKYPEILDATRYYSGYRKWQLTLDNKSFLHPGAAVDQSFLEMFSIRFIRGNPKTAFSDPRSIVITEELANKFFNKLEPTGEIIKLENREFKVAGVIESFPAKSHIKFDFLFPCKNFPSLDKSWGSNNCYTYVLLKNGSSHQAVSKKIAAVIKEYNPTSVENLYLQPLKQAHLYALQGGGAITYIYIFSALAIFTLLIACINFMNLSTARSARRFKEIGIKKAVGASRWQLLTQFMIESIVTAFLALGLAVVLVSIVLPLVNNILGTQLTLVYSGSLFLSLFAIALFTGIISGSYPAFFLSAIKPVNLFSGRRSGLLFKKWLKGSDSEGRLTGSTFRRILVVAQFSLSIFFIVCTLVVFHQVDYMKKADLGYNKEHIIYLQMRGEFKNKYETIKEKLLQNSNILNVTATDMNPVMWRNSTDEVSWEGKKAGETIGMGVRMVDYDYLRTFGLKMAQGRFFSKEFPTDAAQGFIVNEAAVKAMGKQSPVGEKFSLWGRQGTIIGVVKDFHTESLHAKVGPFILCMGPKWLDCMSIRLKSDNIPGSITFIESKIKEFVPDYPFEYTFLDEEIDRLYRGEHLTGKIISYITLLAVLISSLGLFGLASFTAEQRTKEIGIRKVLGASVLGITVLLSKDFIRWIFIANLIAWPAAYFALNKWLQNFAFRINIGLETFIFAGLLALLIALLTVSYQSIKAATSNLVEALRYE